MYCVSYSQFLELIVAPHSLIMSGNGDVCADEGPNNKEKSRGSG
jgi:hypothetical protein